MFRLSRPKLIEVDRFEKNGYLIKYRYVSTFSAKNDKSRQFRKNGYLIKYRYLLTFSAKADIRGPSQQKRLCSKVSVMIMLFKPNLICSEHLDKNWLCSQLLVLFLFS